MKKRLITIALAAVLLFLSGCLGAGTERSTTSQIVPVSLEDETAEQETSAPAEPEATEPSGETEPITESEEIEAEDETAAEPSYDTQGDAEEEELAAVPEPEPTEAPAMTEDSTFEIYFIDVGQGEAACVLCDGEAMLIDGGGKSASSRMYGFLQSHGIGHLSYIVASHPDADHVGGLAGALNYASADKAYCTVDEYDSDAFRDFVKYLDKHDCGITIPAAGETFYLGCARVTVLYPDPDEFLSDNTSIALRIEYGETSFLFTGGCEIDDEAAILLREYDLKSDVLKIAQHGSEQSTSDAFLREIRPSYAVISVGGDNGYGFPTGEVLSRLQDAGVTLYRTDVHGDIHCISDGTEVVFEAEKNADFDPFLAVGGYLNYLNEQTEQTAGEGEDGAEGDVKYIANTNTLKFHKPTCASVKKMNEDNKWYFTGTRDELIDMGYSPCKNCNP